MSRYNPDRSAHLPTRLAVLDIETVAPEQPEGGFPPWPLHTPVVASILLATRERYDQWQFKLESVTFDDESAAVERISQLIERRTCVGFNSRAFDIPVLFLTACRVRRQGLAGLAEAARAPRFSATHHDVLDLLGNFGAARGATLQVLCERLGIPVKLDAHGSEVGAMMANGELANVVNYCEQDVASTLCLYAMVQGLRAASPTFAGSLVSQLGRWVREENIAHLQPFERLPGAGEFDRQSMTGMIQAAIDAMDHRLDMAWITGTPGDSFVVDKKNSDYPG